MTWQEIHHIDQLLTLEINSWHSFITDPIWAFFSDKFVWAPMYAAIIALLIWKLGWKRGLIVLAGALLTFAFCDQFSNLIKHAVGRIRPLNDEFMIAQGLHVLERGGGYSFFSAHSANSFGLAFSTFVGMKRCLCSSGAHSCMKPGSPVTDTSSAMPLWLKAYGWWMFFWAFMVAISRIFVGKHYLGDVIVGILVGSLAGWLLARLAGWLCKKFMAK
jgi:undecaprenyl-diphosphatase